MNTSYLCTYEILYSFITTASLPRYHYHSGSTHSWLDDEEEDQCSRKKNTQDNQPVSQSVRQLLY
jgi:hypothetical protein